MRSRLAIWSFLGLGLFTVTDNTPGFLQSFFKIVNAGVAGAKMASIYKFNHESDDAVKDMSLKHYKASTHLRDALYKNGGIYIKLGQLIATLDVIVPEEYRQILSSLTRKGKYSKFQNIQATIHQDLKQKVQNIFEYLEQQPISSASIAQVHRGKLKNGRLVAVKVQHRELEGNVESDLKVMKWFLYFGKKFFKDFEYNWLLQQFEKNLAKELDFRLEAQNCERTRKFLKRENFLNVSVPQILYLPTKRVLIMEFIDGIHINQLSSNTNHKIDLREMGRQFAKANVQMIHQEGFVHGDPHSGNLMVRKNPKTHKDELIILDHGLYQELTAELRKYYNEFWLGLILKDQQRVQRSALQLGTKNGKMLCSMLTSKDYNDLTKGGRERFNLKGDDRAVIIQRATNYHKDIVSVLNELNRNILLLLKVNEFARTMQNELGGREMGVYEDIGRCCVNNLGFSWWQRIWLYLRIYWVNRT